MNRSSCGIFGSLVILVTLGCSSSNRPGPMEVGGGGSATAERGGAGGSGGGETPSTAAGAPNAGAANSAAIGQAGMASVAGSANTFGSAGTSAVARCGMPIELGVRFVGRVDGCEKDAVRFAWSGSGFVAAFTGTGMAVRLRGKPNQFTIIVDGALQPKLVTQDGDKTYTLATALPAGAHTLELYRRTEASFGSTSVIATTIENGQLEVAPPAPTRLIEVIGDSISCGYGNEGTAPCGFSADTENHYLTYGSLLARGFGAELSTVAWSGKGIASNYGGNKMELIPITYERCVPTEPRSVWTFLRQPQLVIINAGTNDFSANTDPTEADFVTAYQALLATIRSHYPNAYILCTVGPMLSGTDLTAKARPYIASAVQVRRDLGDLNIEAYELLTGNTNPTCDSHPSLVTHAAIADELTAHVRTVLGW